MARNLLIIQSKPAGRSSARSRHRKASHRRRDVINGRCISANGVLFSAAVGRGADGPVPCFSEPSLTTQNMGAPCPDSGTWDSTNMWAVPLFCTSVLHFCFALFLMHSDALRQPFPAPQFARLHPRQLPHFSLPQNFCVSLCHPYVIRASPVYSEDVPLIGRGRIHRRVCPIIPIS